MVLCDSDVTVDAPHSTHPGSGYRILEIDRIHPHWVVGRSDVRTSGSSTRPADAAQAVVPSEYACGPTQA